MPRWFLSRGPELWLRRLLRWLLWLHELQHLQCSSELRLLWQCRSDVRLLRLRCAGMWLLRQRCTGLRLLRLYNDELWLLGR
ncbi:MAG: hypothetical protein U0746_14425 [Gemmataceae bacterium]